MFTSKQYSIHCACTYCACTYVLHTYIGTHVYMHACTYIRMYIISMHKCIHFKMVQTCSAKASWYSFFRLSWFLTNSLWSACSLQSGKDGEEDDVNYTTIAHLYVCTYVLTCIRTCIILPNLFHMYVRTWVLRSSHMQDWPLFQAVSAS